MAKKFSLMNHKGGVAKTTSSLNIAAGFAKMGKKALLVDLDPQANLTQCLNFPKNSDKTIYEAMIGKSPLQVFNVHKNLDIVISCINLVAAEVELLQEPGKDLILADLIKQVDNNYDIIIFDCPPSLGLLTVNALSASDFVIVPVQTEGFAVQGMTEIDTIITKIRTRLNPSLQIGGYLLTRYNQRLILHRDVKDYVANTYKDLVFKTIIRDNVTLAELSMIRSDVFSYQPRSNGAVDYMNLCKEIKKKFF